MSDWWENLFQMMFGGPALQSQQARGQALTYGLGSHVNDAASAWWSVSSPSPSTSPTATQPVAKPSATASPAAPKPTSVADASAAAVNAAINKIIAGDSGSSGPGLYGTLPAGNVYVGGTDRRPRSENAEKQAPTDSISIEESLAQINEWNQRKIDRFNELAIGAGYLDKPTNNLDVIEKVWGDLATRSAKMYQRGIKITPWQLLSRYAGSGGGPGAVSGAPKIVTSTSSSVDLTNPSQARALVDQVLTARLGRAATEAEKKEFLAALNAAEKKNPKTTTTTTTTSATGESVSSSSTSKGGLDAAGFAGEWALTHNKDEAGSYQALATYMPAFYAALGAPV